MKGRKEKAKEDVVAFQGIKYMPLKNYHEAYTYSFTSCCPLPSLFFLRKRR
jgi:hypothetical protein